MGDVVRKTKAGKFIGWYIRYVDENGRRRQRASRQATAADARKLLLQIEAGIARGEHRTLSAKNPTTVIELCELFLREFRSPKIKDIAKYRRTARFALTRILPHVGELQMLKLSRQNLEDARDEISSNYRPNSVRAAFRPLSTAFSWAVRKGMLIKNPVIGIDLPRADRSIEHLTKDEAQALLKAAAEAVELRLTVHYRQVSMSRLVAINLALQLGLRRGEVFGLRWRDIDLESKRITVAKSFQSSTKSGRPRYLPLADEMAELLLKWRPDCPSTDDGLVVPVFVRGGQGWRCATGTGDAGLKQLAKRAGIRRFERGWHALRHTFASQFVMAGGSLLALQKILGHSSIDMTMIYAHLAPDFLAQEMTRVKYG